MLNSEYINNFLKTKEKKPKENNNTKPHKQNKTKQRNQIVENKSQAFKKERPSNYSLS